MFPSLQRTSRCLNLILTIPQLGYVITLPLVYSQTFNPKFKDLCCKQKAGPHKVTPTDLQLWNTSNISRWRISSRHLHSKVNRQTHRITFEYIPPLCFPLSLGLTLKKETSQVFRFKRHHSFISHVISKQNSVNVECLCCPVGLFVYKMQFLTTFCIWRASIRAILEEKLHWLEIVIYYLKDL